MALAVPLSASDLQRIAANLDKINAVFVEDGQYAADTDLVTKIEVKAPDTDTVIGYFVDTGDEWFGFQPLNV
jgi:hypothetical protein